MHGSIGGGLAAWQEQRPLAERWTHVIPDRPGFGAGPLVERVDFEIDAPLVAGLLADGVHLVGRSYGGVVCLLAASQRLEALWSLTVIEPPALAVARDHPAVDGSSSGRSGRLTRPGTGARASARTRRRWAGARA